MSNHQTYQIGGMLLHFIEILIKLHLFIKIKRNPCSFNRAIFVILLLDVLQIIKLIASFCGFI